jgi:creatinine amidohydrolase
VLHKFRRWPGSLAVPPALLGELVERLVVAGSATSPRWLVLSGHDENHETLVTAARAANAACGADVVVAEWAALAAPALASLSESPFEMHGGEILTSLLLFWHPDVVRLTEVEDEGERVGGLLADDLHLQGRAFRASERPPEEGRSGVFGFPAFASHEKGEAVEAAVLAAVDELVRELGWDRFTPASSSRGAPRGSKRTEGA